MVGRNWNFKSTKMKHPESKTIFDKMKVKTGLSNEAMAALGYNIDKLDKAIDQCLSAGMSRPKTIEIIYKMWLQSYEK
jgi:hypothetical protein